MSKKKLLLICENIGKLISKISNKIIGVVLGVCLSIIVVYKSPILLEKANEKYTTLNNDTFKDIISFFIDINTLVPKGRLIYVMSIIIGVICIVLYVVKFILYIKNLGKNYEHSVDEVIIGHSSMGKMQFNVDTNNNYEIEEIDINNYMANSSGDYEQIKYSVNFQDTLIKNFKGKIDNNHEYGYMGIAHTPLILRLGYKIGDENLILLYHKNRNSKYFKKLSDNNDYPKLLIVKEEINKDSNELIVGLATTFEIDNEDLKVLNPDGRNVIIFESEERDFDIITSKNQVDEYKNYILNKVRNIVKEKNISTIHMIISSSVAMTFALGQALSETYDPEIIIYHYDKQSTLKYTWGIKLFKNYNECLVINS